MSGSRYSWDCNKNTIDIRRILESRRAKGRPAVKNMQRYFSRPAWIVYWLVRSQCSHACVKTSATAVKGRANSRSFRVAWGKLYLHDSCTVILTTPGLAWIHITSREVRVTHCHVIGRKLGCRISPVIHRVLYLFCHRKRRFSSPSKPRIGHRCQCPYFGTIKHG
jgi:hypothetical protein